MGNNEDKRDKTTTQKTNVIVPEGRQFLFLIRHPATYYPAKIGQILVGDRGKKTIKVKGRKVHCHIYATRAVGVVPLLSSAHCTLYYLHCSCFMLLVSIYIL